MSTAFVTAMGTAVILGTTYGQSVPAILAPDISIYDHALDVRDNAIPDEQVLPQEAWPAAIGRLQGLRSLGDDHDGEGAAAANPRSIDAALAFLRFLPFYAPDPIVGIDRDGNAVIEFHDAGEFGQVIWRADRSIEAFHREPDGSFKLVEGAIDSPRVSSAFRRVFGFPLEA